jgi:small subunit ribosomal protein S5
MKPKRERPEFDQHILDLARVTRVTKGGKQLSFRACVVIGDRKGRVGFGIDKGKDVQLAVEKAVNQAKKNLIRVPLIKETIPHMVAAKFKAGRVIIMPAPRGSGIIAGSATRVMLELAGVPNASAKIMSKTNNKITNLKATFDALQKFRPKAVLRASAVRAPQPAATPVAPAIVEPKGATRKRAAAPKLQTESQQTV